MQTIKFLRNFFTKGLEIHSSFTVFFRFFNLKFQYSKLKISNLEFFKKFIFQNLKFEKSLTFEFKKLLNFKPVPKGRSHSRQKHLLRRF
jgi:hypothetical protein